MAKAERSESYGGRGKEKEEDECSLVFEVKEVRCLPLKGVKW